MTNYPEWPMCPYCGKPLTLAYETTDVGNDVLHADCAEAYAQDCWNETQRDPPPSEDMLRDAGLL